MSAARLVTLAILALAVVSRWLWLDLKPPHFDEGVNGWFIDQIQRNGSFKYDPTNYHGPLHFYALFLFKVLFGRNLWALRAPLVLAGLATVALLLWRLPRYAPRGAAWLAALGMAVSPAFLYYQRDAIHESWLALFLVASLLGVLGLWQDRTKHDLWLLVAGLTGLVLTKETYIIHVGSALLAWGCARIWGIAVDPHVVVVPERPPRGYDRADVARATGVAALVIVFFYSGNLFRFEDLKGLYLTFAAWAKTGATNKGHTKDWYYWLQLLFRYEWWTLAGLFLSFRWLRPGADLRWRWLSIAALGTLTAYTIIPYKTPWCILAIAVPFVVLAGVGLQEAWTKCTRLSERAVLVVAALGVLGHDGWKAARLSYVDPADKDEEYAYVQTYHELANFTEPILELARRDPRKLQLRGYIVGDSSHPIPWILGEFPRVGYYRAKMSLPKEPPDFVLVTEKRLAEIEGRLDEPYFKERVMVHPAYPTAFAFFRVAEFGAVMEGRTPEFIPGRPVEPEENLTPEEESEEDASNIPKP
ncbi:MAG: glycosyltransferase family 39 protein [Verrucomicrobia bacterium]|nr:glycosyltransferase family 39 protein [Verrucomicrobiota bacterium]